MSSFSLEGCEERKGRKAMQLEGKTALITGGTRGIGAATAVILAQRGANVAIVGRHDDEQAKETRSMIEAFGRRCELIIADMGKPEDAIRCVAEAVKRIGSIDILIHSAGSGFPGRFLEVTPEVWHEAFNVHVHAIYYLCQAVIPMMKEKREGAIVLVSSIAALRGVPVASAYQVVKGALPQFARALAREFADYNIRVNAVAPGIIRTRFHDAMSPAQQKHNIDNRIPLHREGTPQQVADLIAVLVENDYITGETLTIDGGLTMRIA
jgi:NAD(P)-dependent dehydrogenase (short-subunit alcohol dehydrogenase family)